MWYKWAQEKIEEWKIPPEQWGISQKQVDDMIQRLRGTSAHHYRERGQAWKDVSDQEIAMEADNNFEVYNRYLSNLPEEISSHDLLRAYRAGLLPQYTAPPESTPLLDISNAQEVESQGLPWEPSAYQQLNDTDLANLFSIAKNRATPTNKEAVNDARYQIFLASFKDPTICDRMGIKQSDLNKMMRTWTNMPAKSVELEKRINQASSNLTTEWTGISNSAYIAQNNVSPDDIDGFFKEIKLNQTYKEMAYVEGSDSAIDLNADWNSRRGEELRRYILRTVLAIDTHIQYNDLAFEITNVIPDAPGVKAPRGLYNARKKLISIKETNPNTVAHEIGHYLDYKWSEDLVGIGSLNALSDSTLNVDYVFGDNEKAKQFYRIFQEFVMDISERSNVSSEYFQRRHEVFARFIAMFINWTNQKSGYRYLEEPYNDKFYEQDYLKFIKILQTKSFIDAQTKQGK